MFDLNKQAQRIWKAEGTMERKVKISYEISDSRILIIVIMLII